MASKAPAFIGMLGSDAASTACVETARAVTRVVFTGPGVWGSLPEKSSVSRSPFLMARTWMRTGFDRSTPL